MSDHEESRNGRGTVSEAAVRMKAEIEAQEMLEQCPGTLIHRYATMAAKTYRLRLALEAMLDAAERARA